MLECGSNGANVRLYCDRCKRQVDTLRRYVTDDRHIFWLCPSCERQTRVPTKEDE